MSKHAKLAEDKGYAPQEGIEMLMRILDIEPDPLAELRFDLLDVTSRALAERYGSAQCDCEYCFEDPADYAVNLPPHLQGVVAVDANDPGFLALYRLCRAHGVGRELYDELVRRYVEHVCADAGELETLRRYGIIDPG